MSDFHDVSNLFSVLNISISFLLGWLLFFRARVHRRKCETIGKSSQLRVMMFVPSCGGGNTERQLYHDVLIIQRKLCFSFFTVCFLEALARWDKRFAAFTQHSSRWLSETKQRMHCRFNSLGCGCCAYTQWELYVQWGLTYCVQLDPLVTAKNFSF